MMRERKLRVWDKHNHIMIYAEDAQDSKDLLAIGLHGLPIAVDRDSFRGDKITGWNVDHRLIRMDSTGLMDAKGTEIYEGDIVDIEGIGGAEILMKDGQWVTHNEDQPEACGSLYGWLCPIQVIGNIYEPPPEILR
jgi:YopX protein